MTPTVQVVMFVAHLWVEPEPGRVLDTTIWLPLIAQMLVWVVARVNVFVTCWLVELGVEGAVV